MTYATLPLTDPSQSGALLAAANWTRALVTGTPATILATLAVAAIGFLMLQGRLPLRRGLIVVLGCFVIFGAGSIASGLLGATQGAGGERDAVPMAMAAPPPAPVPPPAQPQVYDPYAGASVPPR